MRRIIQVSGGLTLLGWLSAAAQEPQPYFEYVTTEAGVTPYGGGCYPDKLLGPAAEGRVSLQITHCGKPPEAQTSSRLEWTPPPRTLQPGQPFPFTLKVTLTQNLTPSWTLAAMMGVSNSEYAVEPVWFSNAAVAAGPRGNPHSAGEVFTYDNLAKPAEALRAPIERTARAHPGGLVRVNFCAMGSSKYWWSYVYRLVDGQRHNTGTGTGTEPAAVSLGAATRPGAVWKVVETLGNERWEAEWVVQADGKTLHATYRHFPSGGTGRVDPVGIIESFDGHRIAIRRPGLGTYNGTVDPARGTISGKPTWGNADWQVVLPGGRPSSPARSVTAVLTSGQDLACEARQGGKVWPCRIRFSHHEAASGFVRGEVTWLNLSSVHQVEGRLAGGRLTFTETRAIRAGSAHLNCTYDLELTASGATGGWRDPADNSTGSMTIAVE